MISVPSRVRTARTSLIGALFAVTACTSSGESVREVDMLWVGSGADGALASGTLSAEVDLVRVGSALEVDIGDDVDTSGEVWNAAARNAVTTALLLGGVAPEGFRFSVEASDTIDGPSAGGLLGVAALADLLGLRLREGVSMTGTLAPNGSIGPVAGVPEKLRAARSAGISVVVVPSAAREALDPRTGDVVDVEAFAGQLGIDVVFVSSILDAAGVLIDGPTNRFEGATPDEGTTSEVDVESYFVSRIDALVARLGRLDVAEGMYPGQVTRVDRFESRLEEVVSALSSSSESRSDARHPVSLLALEREVLAWNAGVEALDAALESSEAGEVHVRRVAEEVRAAAAEALLDVAMTPFDFVETFMALVDVAEWAADGLEVANAVIAHLDRADANSQYLFEAAVDLAEVTHDLENMLPVALEVALRTGSIPMTDEVLRRAKDLLRLMNLAIAANAELIDVTGRTEGFSIDTTSVIAMFDSFGSADSVVNRVDDVRARIIVSLADSVSRYVESSRIVNLNHLVSLQDPILSDLSIDDSAAIREQIDVAHTLSDFGLGELKGRDLDVTYFSWERHWADLFSGVEGGETTLDRLLDGLTRLWFDNVNQRLLVALTSTRS